MYNLLIVDDEKIIRDGLYELLSMEESLELGLMTAASAIEAKAILEKKKVDIVLTDIQMPKMTGIQLMEVILERWPYCKIIFLTGFSDFDYVYKVHKHARYVLKAEEDEKIIEAINETIEEIENDFMVEEIVEKTGKLQEQQKDRERNQFLVDLFAGLIKPGMLSQQLLDHLEIRLDYSQPIYHVVIRHEYKLKEAYDDQLKFMQDLVLLVERYFFNLMEGVVFHHTKNYLVLLLQPKKLLTTERNSLALKSNGELFQKACQKNFDINVNMAIAEVPMEFREVLNAFQTMKAKLLMASEEEMIIVSHQENATQLCEASSDQKNMVQSGLELLDYYFENNNEENVMAILQETKDMFDSIDSMHDLFAVEVYSTIAVKLIKYINQFQLSQDICFRINVYNLYNVTLHNSWKEAMDYLISVTSFVFELKRANAKKHHEDVVEQVKRYIQEHLGDDTSLDALADLVNLSPEYLLRLFKKSEKVTILQYINDLKIIKAKKMISDGDLQIKDIATKLGFTSSGYFGRFFKSKTGMSPQNYRDQQ